MPKERQDVDRQMPGSEARFLGQLFSNVPGMFMIIDMLNRMARGLKSINFWAVALALILASRQLTEQG